MSDRPESEPVPAPGRLAEPPPHRAGEPPAGAAGPLSSPWTVFLVFLRLGLTSFGGPIAHLGYFREEFVRRRGWFDDTAYADLVALCQFLPGPASSQVGLGVGIARAGLAGGLAAWTGFTLPSAVLMIAFAYGLAAYGDGTTPGWLVGLKALAVAVIADAVWDMGRRLCPDRLRGTIAVAATLLVLLWPLVLGASAAAQVVAIVAGGLAGAAFIRDGGAVDHDFRPFPVSRRTGILALAGFFVLLAGLPVLAAVSASPVLQVIEGFYRSGALVFGGGHVLLPLLDSVAVEPGWVGADQFLAGYGAAQALPGPLFTFAAYLGTAMSAGPGGVAGGLIGLIAIFAPGVLLVVGALPFWNLLRSQSRARATLAGVNAAVVGLLIAALYDPVWTTTVQSPLHFAVVLISFAVLRVWKRPAWQAAVLAAILGALLLGG